MRKFQIFISAFAGIFYAAEVLGLPTDARMPLGMEQTSPGLYKLNGKQFTNVDGVLTYNIDSFYWSGDLVPCPLGMAQVDDSIFKVSSMNIKKGRDLPRQEIRLTDLIDKNVLKQYNERYIAEREDTIKRNASVVADKMRKTWPGDLYLVVFFTNPSGGESFRAAHPWMDFWFEDKSRSNFRDLSGGPFTLAGDPVHGMDEPIPINYKNIDNIVLRADGDSILRQMDAGVRGYRLGLVAGSYSSCSPIRSASSYVNFNIVDYDHNDTTDNVNTSADGISTNGGAVAADPYAQAQSACPKLGEQIDKIKVMAGISLGAGAVGTLAGGAAATVGFMKSAADKKAATPQETPVSDDEMPVESVESEVVASLEQPTETKESFKDKIVGAAPTIQTAGSFVAGGTAAVGAITSFIGAAQFDELIKDMDNCIEAVKLLETKKLELTFESPGNPDIERYGKIVDYCKGFNTKNIKDIKAAMTTSGAFSTIGALAGIAGGVTSVMANKQPNPPDQPVEPVQAVQAEGESPETVKTGPDKAKLGTASNVLSTTSAATSLISTIISGVTLSGLNKNSAIADKCREAF